MFVDGESCFYCSIHPEMGRGDAKIGNPSLDERYPQGTRGIYDMARLYFRKKGCPIKRTLTSRPSRSLQARKRAPHLRELVQVPWEVHLAEHGLCLIKALLGGEADDFFASLSFRTVNNWLENVFAPAVNLIPEVVPPPLSRHWNIPIPRPGDGFI